MLPGRFQHAVVDIVAVLAQQGHRYEADPVGVLIGGADGSCEDAAQARVASSRSWFFRKVKANSISNA